MPAARCGQGLLPCASRLLYPAPPPLPSGAVNRTTAGPAPWKRGANSLNGERPGAAASRRRFQQRPSCPIRPLAHRSARRFSADGIAAHKAGPLLRASLRDLAKQPDFKCDSLQAGSKEITVRLSKESSVWPFFIYQSVGSKETLIEQYISNKHHRLRLVCRLICT